MNTIYEPGKAEINTTLFLGTLIGPFYRAYVDRLGLKGSERVLDYGCGSGVCTRHLAALLKKGGGRLTCVDVSRRWLEVCRGTLRGFPDVEYRLASRSDCIDAPDGAYDAVFIHFTLHEVPPEGRGPVADCLARKLVPGGRLYLREPYVPSGLQPDGMSAEDARAVMRAAGLVEERAVVEKSRLAGSMFAGIYRKERRPEAA